LKTLDVKVEVYKFLASLIPELLLPHSESSESAYNVSELMITFFTLSKKDGLVEVLEKLHPKSLMGTQALQFAILVHFIL
jgi:hypothetical protein